MNCTSKRGLKRPFDEEFNRSCLPTKKLKLSQVNRRSSGTKSIVDVEAGAPGDDDDLGDDDS